MKRFNTTGICLPEKHYMVDISNKLKKIMRMIDYGDYFTINRARQYGKTTTLRMLRQCLPADYICINISFEGIDDSSFESSENFCQMFLSLVAGAVSLRDKSLASMWEDTTVTTFALLAKKIKSNTVNRKIVLTIDEVDKTSHNRVFLLFIGMLRNMFLSRADAPAFQSVILAGVYDIKNIKLKMEKEGILPPSEKAGKLLNSPWNIAADFEVDMSFNPAEIATMLQEYEAEHNTNMDTASIADEIYKYTSGYPFLVSRICYLIDTRLDGDWTVQGVKSAVKNIVNTEKNTLFDELFKNVVNNTEIYKLMYDILVKANKKPRSRRSQPVEWAEMFGFLRVNSGGEMHVSNKIFEAVLLDHFIAEESVSASVSKEVCSVLRNEIIKDGVFDMELCLRKFAEFYKPIYKNKNATFYEEHGKLFFLAYLHPLVNGRGFYHIEPETSAAKRMDVVLDYGTNQYIIELKIWHGDVAHSKAHEQLLGYMDSKNADKGYLLTFDLRTEDNKQPKAEWIDIGSKQIFDVVV